MKKPIILALTLVILSCNKELPITKSFEDLEVTIESRDTLGTRQVVFDSGERIVFTFKLFNPSNQDFYFVIQKPDGSTEPTGVGPFPWFVMYNDKGEPLGVLQPGPFVYGGYQVRKVPNKGDFQIQNSWRSFCKTDKYLQKYCYERELPPGNYYLIYNFRIAEFNQNSYSVDEETVRLIKGRIDITIR